MSMTVYTLASGSSGNCTLVSDGAVHMLIDAGISCRRITTSLAKIGLTAADLRGIFITHEHSDHISGLQTLTKNHRVPLYAAPPTARQIAYRVPFADHVLTEIHPEEEICLDSLTVQGFETSHDSAYSMGYTVSGERGKMALATDLGMLTDTVREAVAGVDLLIAECNHDLDLLECGAYPYYLKQRIRGMRGHLCNEEGAELCRHSAVHGAKQVILAHLSAENNTPRHARKAVEDAFAAGFIEGVGIHLPPRGEMSQAFAVV